jgi:hypothetical protein
MVYEVGKIYHALSPEAGSVGSVWASPYSEKKLVPILFKLEAVLGEYHIGSYMGYHDLKEVHEKPGQRILLKRKMLASDMDEVIIRGGANISWSDKLPPDYMASQINDYCLSVTAPR